HGTSGGVGGGAGVLARWSGIGGPAGACGGFRRAAGCVPPAVAAPVARGRREEGGGPGWPPGGGLAGRPVGGGGACGGGTAGAAPEGAGEGPLASSRSPLARGGVACGEAAKQGGAAGVCRHAAAASGRHGVGGPWSLPGGAATAAESPGHLPQGPRR